MIKRPVVSLRHCRGSKSAAEMCLYTCSSGPSKALLMLGGFAISPLPFACQVLRIVSPTSASRDSAWACAYAPGTRKGVNIQGRLMVCRSLAWHLGTVLWQLMPFYPAGRGNPCQTNCLVKYSCAAALSIAHDKCQEGSKGGNGILSCPWGLACCRIENHRRPHQTQMGARGWGGGVRRNK